MTRAIDIVGPPCADLKTQAKWESMLEISRKMPNEVLLDFYRFHQRYVRSSSIFDVLIPAPAPLAAAI